MNALKEMLASQTTIFPSLDHHSKDVPVKTSVGGYSSADMPRVEGRIPVNLQLNEKREREKKTNKHRQFLLGEVGGEIWVKHWKSAPEWQILVRKFSDRFIA